MGKAVQTEGYCSILQACYYLGNSDNSDIDCSSSDYEQQQDEMYYYKMNRERIMY